MKLLHLATLLAFISAALLHHSTLLAAQDESIPPQVQSSVDRGLDWLAHTQDTRTGSWPVNLDRPTPSIAVTSLAVMAFMARGHVPGQGPYGDNVNRGIDFVLTQQQDNGLLSSANIRQAMYDHGIASIMLCEAYGMVDEPRQQRIKTVVAKAVRLILNAQTLPKTPRDVGGWRYTPTSEDSDISVTGWQLMALRGAANIGAPVPRKAIELGIAYIKRRAVDGGGFSYILNGDPNAARTGTGILSLELLGQHHTKEALAGGDYLLRNALAGAHPIPPAKPSPANTTTTPSTTAPRPPTSSAENIGTIFTPPSAPPSSNANNKMAPGPPPIPTNNKAVTPTPPPCPSSPSPSPIAICRSTNASNLA